MTQFTAYAEKVAATAATYKTQAACKAALTTLNNKFQDAGSYGVLQDARREAIAAIQDRFAALRS